MAPLERLAQLVAGSLLWVCAGCWSSTPSDYGVGCAQFPDVVVPSGMDLQDRGHQSFSREEGSWRQGHFVYHGGNRVGDAASYVRQRMPQHGWELTADEAASENKVRLHFERGPYVADYLVFRQDGVTQMVVDYKTDFAKR